MMQGMGSLFLHTVVFAASAACFAQTSGTGSLVGTVRDTSGALVAGAKVSIVNTETQFVSNTVTSAEGAYAVPYLAPGSYRITIEASGFKKFNQTGVEVRTGEAPRIEIKLEVGAVSESINVMSGAPLLETETSSSGAILSGNELAQLPVSQKAVQRMLWYYPGASSMSGYHILGQRQNMIGFTVDGRHRNLLLL